MDSHVFRPYLCVVDINECSPNQCNNGGSCTDLVNGFSCSCVAGYNGDDCSNGNDHNQHTYGLITLHTYIYIVYSCFHVFNE